VTGGVDIGSSIAWGASGIVYVRRGGLSIVSPQGGPPRVLTTLDAARHEVLHADPLVLPGGRTVLFSSHTTQPGAERIEAVSTSEGSRSVIVERAVTPTWSATGHLLFARDGAVLAAPFDSASATLRGAAMPVIREGVVGTQRSGTLGLRLSPAGTLAFIPSDTGINRVVSVGRDGAALPLNLPLARHTNPRLSPDGRRLLVATSDAFLEALDLTRGTRVRLTAAAPGTYFPSWTADGQRVVFRRYNSPFWVAADGSGKQGLVPGTVTNDFPSAPGPDPDSVIVVRGSPDTSGDIFLISISGRFAPRPLVATRAYEGGPQLSPDGRFLLYQSNESGQFEVYVRRYPILDRSWQASEGGGVQPRWGAAGREIVYRNGRSVMAVTFEAAGAEPVFRRPVALFADDYDFGQGTSIANYDVTARGDLIMLRREPDAGRVRGVLNWSEELKRILATGGVR
jgi:serine/threonine-protein kinase